MKMRASYLIRTLERSGLNAEKDMPQLIEFNPKELLARARSRRNFSEHFDSFSDAYIWVLSALVALAYLFSALLGVLFVLLGEGVPHHELPTAVWGMRDLSLVLLVLAALAIFRVMLFIGPCGLSAAKAHWWLPLPIRLRNIRRSTWRNAVLAGLFAGSFLGALWLIIMLGLAGSLQLPVAGLALGSFAVMGIGIANVATVIQSLNMHATARRISGWAMSTIALVLVVLWLLMMGKVQWAQALVEELSSATLNQQAWLNVLLVLVVLCVASSYWAYRQFEQITGQALRVAGHQQQFAMGTLMQLDSRGLAAPAQTAIHRRRGHGARLTAKLPVAWRILILRLLRGGRWQATALCLTLMLLLAAAVQQIANPLSAAAFYLLLCVVLPLSISRIVAPLLGEQQLTQMLGLSESQLARAATCFALLFAATALVFLTGGLGILDMIQIVHPWRWGAALSIASLGCAAASSAHAQRGERDWGTLLGSASNEMTIATVLFLEAVTYIRVAATFSPLVVLVLNPAATISWVLWACALLFGGSALLQIFRKN